MGMTSPSAQDSAGSASIPGGVFANLRAIWKFTRFIGWSLLLIPPQLVIMAFVRGQATYILPVFWHRRISCAFQIKVETEGTPVKEQAIYVSNHLSYLDIPAISTVLGASFVAKSDVASWPVFGFLAKLHQTAFISRARRDVNQGRNALENTLREGKSLIIFPEGTSSNGAAVLPFKSSLFSILLEKKQEQSATPTPCIQPFSIELVSVDGRLVQSDADRDLYAWHGDMTLMPHFWAFAKTRGATIKLHFHAPVKIEQGHDRKTLAQTCYKKVANGLPLSLVPALAVAA